MRGIFCEKGIKMEKQSVAVVGLGYVGLPLALLAKKQGYTVTGIDYDKEKVELINRGVSPFIDSSITKELKANPIEASSDYQAVGNADIVIVCVPTPVDEQYMPDLMPVTSACTAIAKVMHKGQLVIIESTINPGVCDEVIVPLLEKESGLKCGIDFFLAHCPERINPGDPEWDVSNIARVVGGHDKKSLELAVAFYEDIVDATIKPMGSLKEAEAVKVVENSFRDVNIAFVNELAMSFNKLGIDVVNVIDGAATKPFAFMPHYPGTGVGGHCIPVDPYYLIEYAKKNGFHHEFLKTARSINNGMPNFTIDLLRQELEAAGKNIDGAKVTVLGLSYKANVGDLRESPSIKIIQELEAHGAEIAVNDPYIDNYRGYAKSFTHQPEKAFFENAADLSLVGIRNSFNGADAVIIATAHAEYKKLTADDFTQAGIAVVIDGRNMFKKNIFESTAVRYKGIGR